MTPNPVVISLAGIPACIVWFPKKQEKSPSCLNFLQGTDLGQGQRTCPGSVLSRLICPPKYVKKKLSKQG